MASDDFEGGLDDGSTPSDGNSGGGFYGAAAVNWFESWWPDWLPGQQTATAATIAVTDVAGDAGDGVAAVGTAIDNALPSQTSFVIYLIAAIIILFLIAYITREVAG